MSDAPAVKQAPPVQIVYQGGEYWVSMNVARLSASHPVTPFLVVWLSGLKESDHVRIFLHTGSGGTDQTLDQYMPLINAVMLCRATVVGVVDHIFSDYSAYVLLACSQLSVTRFGQLTLSPLWSQEEDRASEAELAQMYPALLLLGHAQEQGWITQDEVDSVKQRHTAFISQQKLHDRLM